jgi:hypothetical protein
MRKGTKIALAVGAALSLGAAAFGLSAHPYDGGEGGYGPGYGMGYGPGYGMGGGMGYGMHGGYAMHGYGPGGPGAGPGSARGFGAYPGAAEARLAGLKAELGITAKQEPAWDAFVKSVKQRDESRQAWFEKRREARAPEALPDRLKQRDEFFKQQQAERQATTAAVTKLYAELSPEQKAIADQRLGGYGPGYGPGARLR